MAINTETAYMEVDSSYFHKPFQCERCVDDYLPKEEDDYDGLVRTLTVVAYCPLHSQCSSNSWGKHQPWSLATNLDIAIPSLLGQLKYHLVESRLHAMDADSADELLHGTSVGIKFLQRDDTYAHRNGYRKWHWTQTQKKQQLKASKVKRGQSQPGDGSVRDVQLPPPCATELAELNPLLRNFLSALMEPRDLPDAVDNVHIQLTNASGTLAVPERKGNGKGMKRTIDVARLHSMRETLRRGEQSLASAMMTMVEETKRVRAEWQATQRARIELDELLQ